MYKRIVVKIGTKVITENGRLIEERLRVLVEQVAQLRARGVDVIVVTSGAVATGKGILALEKSDSPATQQVYSAVGQVGLMSRYERLFRAHGLHCAQILVTKGDFRDKEHYANMKSCFENLLREKIVPIVNENDAISIPKLVFTDNDELAGLIGSQLNVDSVVFLTSVEGVLVDGESTISEIRENDIDEYKQNVRDTKSAGGRGGMQTKFIIAKRLMAQGIPVLIAKGTHENVLLEIADGRAVGTKFVPGAKRSAAKRRLAYSEGLAVGAAYVDEGAAKILVSKQSVSLLPVGITRVEGDFKKGDTIEVRNASGKKLGFGVAQYDVKTALTLLGKKGARALIHYNYLVMD